MHVINMFKWKLHIVLHNTYSASLYIFLNFIYIWSKTNNNLITGSIEIWKTKWSSTLSRWSCIDFVLDRMSLGRNWTINAENLNTIFPRWQDWEASLLIRVFQIGHKHTFFSIRLGCPRLHTHTLSCPIIS